MFAFWIGIHIWHSKNSWQKKNALIMGCKKWVLRIIIKKWRIILYSYSYFLYIKIRTCFFYSHNNDIREYVCLFVLVAIKLYNFQMSDQLKLLFFEGIYYTNKHIEWKIYYIDIDIDIIYNL